MVEQKRTSEPRAATLHQSGEVDMSRFGVTAIPVEEPRRDLTERQNQVRRYIQEYQQPKQQNESLEIKENLKISKNETHHARNILATTARMVQRSAHYVATHPKKVAGELALGMTKFIVEHSATIIGGAVGMGIDILGPGANAVGTAIKTATRDMLIFNKVSLNKKDGLKIEKRKNGAKRHFNQYAGKNAYTPDDREPEKTKGKVALAGKKLLNLYTDGTTRYAVEWAYQTQQYEEKFKKLQAELSNKAYASETEVMADILIASQWLYRTTYNEDRKEAQATIAGLYSYMVEEMGKSTGKTKKDYVHEVAAMSLTRNEEMEKQSGRARFVSVTGKTVDSFYQYFTGKTIGRAVVGGFSKVYGFFFSDSGPSVAHDVITHGNSGLIKDDFVQTTSPIITKPKTEMGMGGAMPKLLSPIRPEYIPPVHETLDIPAPHADLIVEQAPRFSPVEVKSGDTLFKLLVNKDILHATAEGSGADFVKRIAPGFNLTKEQLDYLQEIIQKNPGITADQLRLKVKLFNFDNVFMLHPEKDLLVLDKPLPTYIVRKMNQLAEDGTILLKPTVNTETLPPVTPQPEIKMPKRLITIPTPLVNEVPQSAPTAPAVAKSTQLQNIHRIITTPTKLNTEVTPAPTGAPIAASVQESEIPANRIITRPTELKPPAVEAQGNEKFKLFGLDFSPDKVKDIKFSNGSFMYRGKEMPLFNFIEDNTQERIYDPHMLLAEPPLNGDSYMVDFENKKVVIFIHSAATDEYFCPGEFLRNAIGGGRVMDNKQELFFNYPQMNHRIDQILAQNPTISASQYGKNIPLIMDDAIMIPHSVEDLNINPDLKNLSHLVNNEDLTSVNMHGPDGKMKIFDLFPDNSINFVLCDRAHAQAIQLFNKFREVGGFPKAALDVVNDPQSDGQAYEDALNNLKNWLSTYNPDEYNKFLSQFNTRGTGTEVVYDNISYIRDAVTFVQPRG